jgi:hypothetical protein
MNIKTIIIVIFCFSPWLLGAYNYFSPVFKAEMLFPSEYESEYKLEHGDIIVNSEEVWQDSVRLERDRNYILDYQTGILELYEHYPEIKISYMIYPEDLIRRYSLYEIQSYSEDEDIRATHRAQLRRPTDSDLVISGNKTISVSVANNADFDLDQSLYLKISGELSKNVNVEAQLTDTQTPITPEGTTRELSNIEKILLRIYGSNYELAFGDLEMEFRDTEFMNFTPQFEGLKASWFGNSHYQAAIALSKGKNATLTFHGVEAKQGPYYLRVSGSGVQVIAGSETVILDGETMQRGLDYTIDYAEGSITFTNRHFISSQSFIQVTFQYSDEQYRQNMYLASAKQHIADNIKIRSNMIVQNDDKDNPIGAVFSDDDIELLKQAGDAEVWASGVFQTDPGEGLYIKKNDNGEEYFEYVGPDGEGNYNLSFSYVGIEEGAYQRADNDQYYEYVGVGKGAYLPVRLLTAPQNKANYNTILYWREPLFTLSAEGLFTQHDKNTFSSVDNENNDGYGSNIALILHPDLDRFNPELNLSYRTISENASTFADLYSSEQLYEFTSLPDTVALSETTAGVKFDIAERLYPSFSMIHQKGQNYATQQNFIARSRYMSSLLDINYRYSEWKQHYQNETHGNRQQINHRVNSTLKIRNFDLSGEYFSRRSTLELDEENELNQKEQFWKLALASNLQAMTSELSYKEETTDSLDTEDNWTKIRSTNTISLNTLFNSQKHRARFSYSRRNINLPEKKGYDMADLNLNSAFLKDAVRLQTGYSLRNVQYYPKERELIQVSYGLYDSTGVIGGEGGYDWVITSIDYDNPEMAVDLNANATLTINPQMLTSSFWDRFQSESYILASENSKTTDKLDIYFFHPNAAMDDENTIYGRQVLQQTLWTDVIRRKLTGQIRYRKEKMLDNRFQYRESKESDLWEFIARLNFLRNIQLEVMYETTNETESRYDSAIDTDALKLDLRSRLLDDMHSQTGLTLSKETGEHLLMEDSYTIQSIEISERITYYVDRKYRFFSRLTMRYNKKEGGFLGFLPEKREGTILTWSSSMDYRMNNYTTARLEYSGNSYPQQSAVHQVKAEIRAEF